jgi:hypothetical protein
MKIYDDITKILVIIDDDLCQARVNEIVLQTRCGIKNTKIFTNPGLAFQYLAIHGSEVCGIITDAYMYVDGCRITTGMQLINEINDLGLHKNLPVLFCTSLDGILEKTMMLSFGEFIKKPLIDHTEDDDSELYRFLDRCNENK